MASVKSQLAHHGYALGNALDQGGQATVYLATKANEPDGPTFVLKVLKNVDSSQAYARFQREVQALQKVSHPGIVRVATVIDDAANSFHCYLMEHIPDLKPLKKVFADARSPFIKDPLSSLVIYKRIVDALAECESHNIVHRDLSLGNVLVTPDLQQVKLIDFGCCDVFDGDVITLTDEAVGTVGFRAPECRAHSREAATTKADLYAAGKILWCLVTGKRVFEDERRVFTDLSMNSFCPENPLTWHLHHIFEKTIRVRSEDRYESARKALGHAELIEGMIRGGLLPLEKLAEGYCPQCRVGKTVDAERFKNNKLIAPDRWDNEQDAIYPRLPRVQAGYPICTYCGHINLAAPEIAKRALEYRKSLS